MKEIDHTVGIDCEITMKEISPIVGTDHENTMTEINYAKGIEYQSITKTIMKEIIIIHFRTMEIGENIKIVIRTNIGIKISMIMIYPMIWTIFMVETGHIVETSHIVEIDCETTVEMSRRRKIIDIREGLEIIMRMSMRTGMVWININTNTEMTKLEVGQKNNLAHMVMKIVIVHTQSLKNCTKSCYR